jgi:hypothetical protein
VNHGSIDQWQDFLSEDVFDPFVEALNFRDWWERREAERKRREELIRILGGTKSEGDDA